MNWLKQTFGVHKPIIAMCHLQALPGDPFYDSEGGMDKVIELARQDLKHLQDGGVDAIMFSNEFSLPYLTTVKTATTAAMARIVGELFVGHDTWCRETFAPYIAERRERLRRLRAAAAFVTTLNGRYGTEDKARRERAFASMASSSQPMHPGFAAYVGPEALPAELFEPEYYEAVFGTRRYFVA